MEKKELRIKLEDRDEEAVARRVAAAHPEVQNDLPTGQTIAPIMAVLIAAGVAALVTWVMDFWQSLKGGLVIDLRGETTDEIYRDRDVPPGLIIIHAKDGTVKIESKDTPKTAIQQLIESVIGGVIKSASEIAKAATDAGAKASTPATV